MVRLQGFFFSMALFFFFVFPLSLDRREEVETDTFAETDDSRERTRGVGDLERHEHLAHRQQVHQIYQQVYQQVDHQVWMRMGSSSFFLGPG